MAIRTWTDGEVVTASAINQWSSDIEDVKDDCIEERERCEDAVAHNPMIQTGTWWVWNPTTSQYQDTNVKATDNLTVESSKSGKVTTVLVKVNNVTVATLTINDGQDGSGSGDMTKSAYDSTSAVETAGGIVSYVAGEVPTKTSDLTNDSGFLTQHQSLSAYRTSSAQDTIDNGKEAKGYLTIGGTTYQIRTGTSGASGYITIETE